MNKEQKIRDLMEGRADQLDMELMGQGFKFTEMKPVLKRALIVDLDGTVRRSKSGKMYIENDGDIEIIPGVEKKLWYYRIEGYLILAVSNQGGVAHGIKTLDEVQLISQIMCELFNENPFHSIKHSPFHEKGNKEPYNHRSLLRKPYYGMLVMHEADCWEMGYMIDWDNSLFIGDRPEDEECAKSAGIAYKHIDQFLADPIAF